MCYPWVCDVYICCNNHLSGRAPSYYVKNQINKISFSHLGKVAPKIFFCPYFLQLYSSPTGPSIPGPKGT